MSVHRVDGWLGWVLAPMPHEQDPGHAGTLEAADSTTGANPGRAGSLPLAERVGR